MSSKICTMDAQGHICKYELEVSSGTPLGLRLEMLVNRLLPTGHQVVEMAVQQVTEATKPVSSLSFSLLQVIQTDFCPCSCLSQDGQQPGSEHLAIPVLLALLSGPLLYSSDGFCV